MANSALGIWKRCERQTHILTPMMKQLHYVLWLYVASWHKGILTSLIKQFHYFLGLCVASWHKERYLNTIDETVSLYSMDMCHKLAQKVSYITPMMKQFNCLWLCVTNLLKGILTPTMKQCHYLLWLWVTGWLKGIRTTCPILVSASKTFHSSTFLRSALPSTQICTHCMCDFAWQLNLYIQRN